MGTSYLWERKEGVRNSNKITHCQTTSRAAAILANSRVTDDSLRREGEQRKDGTSAVSFGGGSAPHCEHCYEDSRAVRYLSKEHHCAFIWGLASGLLRHFLREQQLCAFSRFGFSAPKNWVIARSHNNTQTVKTPKEGNRTIRLTWLASQSRNIRRESARPKTNDFMSFHVHQFLFYLPCFVMDYKENKLVLSSTTVLKVSATKWASSALKPVASYTLSMSATVEWNT